MDAGIKEFLSEFRSDFDHFRGQFEDFEAEVKERFDRLEERMELLSRRQDIATENTQAILTILKNRKPAGGRPPDSFPMAAKDG